MGSVLCEGRSRLRNLAALLVIVTAASSGAAEENGPGESRKRAETLFRDGNYREAYELFREVLLDPRLDPQPTPELFEHACKCLQELSRHREIFDLGEAVAAVRKDDWRMLWKVAQRQGLPAWSRAMEAARKQPNEDGQGRFYFELGRAILYHAGPNLLELTDMSLPSEMDAPYWYSYAPVDEQGNPIFHRRPRSFESARTDGERWRWCLAHAVEIDPALADEVDIYFAEHLRDRYGSSSITDELHPTSRATTAAQRQTQQAIYDSGSLSDDETICRLATGIRRFKLPDDGNFIKIFRHVAERGDRKNVVWAYWRLAEIYTERRQYVKAADCWRRYIKLGGYDGERRLAEIVEPRGRFEPVPLLAPGKEPTVKYVCRNTRKVRFKVQKIDIDWCLSYQTSALRNPRENHSFSPPGLASAVWAFATDDERPNVGQSEWSMDLTPREDHMETEIPVRVPVQKAGLYVLTVDPEENAGDRYHYDDHAVLWLADTVLVQRPLKEGTYYFVADAVTGEPITNAELRFLGYEATTRGQGGILQAIDVKEFSTVTDAQGGAVVGPDRLLPEYSWYVTARTKDGRFAQLDPCGRNANLGEAFEQPGEACLAITDRPIYRPGHRVHFKFWTGYRNKEQKEPSPCAGRELVVAIQAPQGEEEVYRQRIKADSLGGVEGSWTIPTTAPLGVYRLSLRSEEGVLYGGWMQTGTFRVEEYRKPEFDVSIEAPTEPVVLGDRFHATVRARYHFGSPVTEGKVRVRVERFEHRPRWHPEDWDWLYGSGGEPWGGPYSPGMIDPSAAWQPACLETVLSQELSLGPEGTAAVEIDTAAAKGLYGDDDYDYTITAQVVDRSRRFVDATATVVVGPSPFKVAATFDRGYYHAGETIEATFTARTMLGTPVRGTGALKAYRIRDEEGGPRETLVHTRTLSTDERGLARLQVASRAAGRYRFSCCVTDAAGRSGEGSGVVTILGQDDQNVDFASEPLELIADKPQYRPGEVVRLLVNTDRPQSTVLLFVRVADGEYSPPELVRMKGRSAVYELRVGDKDVPNFFVEAATVSGIRLHSVVREIRVPPAERLLQVTAAPSSPTYRPGERAKVKVRITDHAGHPLVGSAVVTVYDKALDQIAGGSNVPDVQQWFWGWRRWHQACGESNLSFRGFFPTNSEWSRLDGRDDDRERNSDLSMAAGAPLPEGSANEGVAMVEPKVRARFDDTAFWAGSLITGPDGTATVEFNLPENLTHWQVRVWGLGPGTKVGQGEAQFTSRKALLLRIQTPRFLIERDEIVLSANIHNDLPLAEQIQPILELEGGQLETLGLPPAPLTIEPGRQARVDWRVRVLREGEATVRMKALGRHESDAMELRVPCRVHGMLKTASQCGVIRPEAETARLAIDVPPTRRPEQTRLEIRYSPTLAGAIVDAVPYLVDYPYGCTEQTMNRFVGAAIAQRTLQDMGVDLEAVRNKRANLIAQELGDDAQRKAQWNRRSVNPLFEAGQVAALVRRGLERLAALQMSDGGWGWFSSFGEHSSPHVTALIVHGLQVAEKSEVIRPTEKLAHLEMLTRAVDWLAAYREDRSSRLKHAIDWREKNRADESSLPSVGIDLDCLVHMVLVDAGRPDQQLQDRLYALRKSLSVYALAALGLAAEKTGDKEKLGMLLRNIAQYLEQDEENQTAWLRVRERGSWWHWHNSLSEANAWYLRLLARVDPKGPLAPRLAKYLVIQRKNATYWDSTRDTALCVEAIADYLRASGEAHPQATLEIWLDGRLRKSVEINRSNLFDFDNKLIVEGAALQPGRHVIELKRKGQGTLYYNSYLTSFSEEERIGRAGLEIKVDRKYFLLQRVEKSTTTIGSRGQPAALKLEEYQRQPLPADAAVRAGDLVEVELEVDAKNSYEYLAVEDQKPAGFEPLMPLSGYHPGFEPVKLANEPGWYRSPAYVEYRDDRVVYFVPRLEHGKHRVSYRARAEMPGRVSALPARAWGMYAPELRANSDELPLTVTDGR